LKLKKKLILILIFKNILFSFYIQLSVIEKRIGGHVTVSANNVRRKITIPYDNVYRFFINNIIFFIIYISFTLISIYYVISL